MKMIITRKEFRERLKAMEGKTQLAKVPHGTFERYVEQVILRSKDLIINNSHLYHERGDQHELLEDGTVTLTNQHGLTFSYKEL